MDKYIDEINKKAKKGIKRKKRNTRILKKILFVLLIVIISCVLIYFGKKLYDEYKYKQTYEYKLLTIGYSLEDTIIIQDKLSNEKIDQILLKDYNNLIPKIIVQKYFIFNNLDRYIGYANNNENEKIENVISVVNVNKDKGSEQSILADTSLKDKMLVNSYYKLTEDYVPENLVKISKEYSFSTEKMNKEAYDNYKEMYKSAKESNIKLLITSGYRSYLEQKDVYDNYVKKYGKSYATKTVANAGDSEHQTGLAVDVFGYGTTMSNFKDSNEYKWLNENSYKYGFILRYPEYGSKLFGYNFESWHYRYVGKDLAKKIYEEGITFEEYYAYYIETSK